LVKVKVDVRFTILRKIKLIVMKKSVNVRLVAFLFLFIAVSFVYGQDVKIKLVSVADVHATIFPHDFANDRPVDGSLARVKTYVDEQRALLGDNVVLLDNGDLLQGQPAGYYFNYIADGEELFFARVMNYIGFDAGSVGNHDIETGWEVYNPLRLQFDFPWLSANILHIRTGKPFFEPYTIIERSGVRIAVMGLVTPSVPNWLPRKLWEGLEFTSMYSAASYWMDHIRENEKPDVIVGLFHSGAGPDIEYAGDDIYLENASHYIGKYVPGFDVIFTAHDHRVRNQTFFNKAGNEVIMIAGQPFGRSAAVVDLYFKKSDSGGYQLIRKSGEIVEMAQYEPCPVFMSEFASEVREVREFVNQPITRLQSDLRSRDSYWGNSAFTDFIHQIQLELTGADISFAAPLSFDATISAGTVYMRDMFNLYPFENYLYKMDLTGEEIKNFLEFSYSLWLNTMEGPEDHLLLFRDAGTGRQSVYESIRLANAFYNFDSAAGINYTVDVSKKPGDRITIKSFVDGSPFDANKKYSVAINSYRGSGGGGHLTEGAGIEHALLESRITWVSENDLRSHIASYLQRYRSLDPKPGNNWQIIPQDWAQKAAERDKKLLFQRRDN
jgi:2',3'-cyclic-nucleotide 2'-phosphodiesterase / 3'-nucleotidase